MTEFIKGTTPLFTIQLTNGVRYDELGSTLFFRFKQGNVVVDEVPLIRQGENIAVIKLKQEDTLKFKAGKVQVQLIGVDGPEETEMVIKSDIAEVIAKDSIINAAIHNTNENNG